MAKSSSRPETVGTTAEAAPPGQTSDQPDKLIEELREAIRVRDDFLAIFCRTDGSNRLAACLDDA